MVATADTTKSFERFYAEEFAQLVPTLHALAGDRGRAEDLAQEALRRAHEHWDQIATYDRPGAWVRRVALNLAANAARGRGREARALQLVAPVAPLELPAADEALWALVRELPEQQRNAVVLHYVEDQSVADVAAVLEVSEGTVKTHLSRARATLATRLAETSGGDHA
jgi:RNA polymerase sigma-70 factor, ECF subfamily